MSSHRKLETQVPDYAVFRVGHILTRDDDSDRLYGNYDKIEIYAGVTVGLPNALCWPPIASFTWDWNRLLTEADYQTLTFPPGWQTELYRGVVMAWTSTEAEALPSEVEHYREEARRWIDENVPTHLDKQM